MAPVPPFASVIVPVHDGEAHLGEQLEALRPQVGEEVEVIVVLNRCRDGSEAVARRAAERMPLRIVPADERPGVGHARNVGARAASGEVLLFCDSDDRVGPTWVAAMSRALADSEADFVGARCVVDRSGLSTWAYDLFYSRLDGASLVLHPPATWYPLGATLGVRASAFAHVAGFDEALLAGFDEVDLARRLFRSGFRLGVAAEADITYRPRTTIRGLYRQRRSYAQGRYQLLAGEGRAVRPAGPHRRAAGIATLVAWHAVRSGERRPIALTALATERWLNEREKVRRWRQGARPDERARVDELVVPPATPIIGGLAFEAPSKEAHRWQAGGWPDRSAMASVALVRPGDVVLDVGAGIGCFTIAAALAGANQRIHAIESDTARRSALHTNVRRHGVEGLVTTSGCLDTGSAPPSLLHVHLDGTPPTGYERLHHLLGPDTLVVMTTERGGRDLAERVRREVVPESHRWWSLGRRGGRTFAVPAPRHRGLTDPSTLIAAPASREADVEALTSPT